MKRKIFSLLLVIGLLAGCGEVPKLANGQDAVVSFNNGDKISVDEFYNQIKEQYGLNTLVTMIDSYVLKTKFPNYSATAMNNADSYISQLRNDYQDDQKLLQDIQSYMGFTSIEAYRDYIYLSYYEKYATEQYIKENLTDKEIEKYYKENIKEDIELSHILITPNVTTGMTAAEQSKAEEEALNTVNTILKELKNTKSSNLSTKFAELAKTYSEDDTTKENGGSLGRVNTTTLGSTYKPLVDAAYTIKDNNYYTKVVKTTLGYHIVLRGKSYDKTPLEDVKETIIEALVSEEMSKNSAVSINALQHYRKELGMEISDPDLNKAFNNYVTNSLSNALNS